MRRGNHEYVKHYLVPGTVFYLPTTAKYPKTWLVKDILRIFQTYNASSANFTFLHVADETNHWNCSALISFYKEWKTVYREGWHFSEQYTALEVECVRVYVVCK
jgi:hypothetical protein